MRAPAPAEALPLAGGAPLRQGVTPPHMPMQVAQGQDVLPAAAAGAGAAGRVGVR